MTNKTNNKKAKYLKTIGIINNNPLGRGFAHPVDICIDENELYILNKHPGFTRVGVCTFDEEYLREFGSYGQGKGQFQLPTGVTISDTTVFVCDEYHNNVSMFEKNGKFMGAWGTHGNGEDEIDGPSGIVSDKSGHIYVSDQNNHRIQKFTENGTHISNFGSYGDGRGQLNQPWGLTTGPDGSIYVADWGNHRIQRFDQYGVFIETIGGPNPEHGSLHCPSKPAVGKDGYVYVADWGNESVKIYNPDGDFIQKMRGEATLSKWAKDFLDANPDENNERIKSDLMPELPDHFNTPYLVSTQIESYFWGPASLYLDENQRLHVVEVSRHRIQIYDTN